MPGSCAKIACSKALTRGPMAAERGDTVRSTLVSRSDTGSLHIGGCGWPVCGTTVRKDMVGLAAKRGISASNSCCV